MTNEHREQAREIVEQFSLHKVQLIEPPTNRQYHFDFNELIDEIAAALPSRDAEVREVLEGLMRTTTGQLCWCGEGDYIHNDGDPACLAARALYERVQPITEETNVT